MPKIEVEVSAEDSAYAYFEGTEEEAATIIKLARMLNLDTASYAPTMRVTIDGKTVVNDY